MFSADYLIGKYSFRILNYQGHRDIELYKIVGCLLEKDSAKFIVISFPNAMVHYIYPEKIKLPIVEKTEDGLDKITIYDHNLNKIDAIIYVKGHHYHRDDGPAVQVFDGALTKTFYYRNGMKYSPEDFLDQAPENIKEKILFNLDEMK